MPKNTGGSYCAVAQCKNSHVKSRKNNMNLSFHRFPQDERKSEWLIRCKRADKIDPQIGSSYFVCSAHFDDDDFEPDLRAKLMKEQRRRRLKSTAVPHLNLSSSTSLGNNNSVRWKKKQMKQNDSEVPQIVTTLTESVPLMDTVDGEMSKDNSNLSVYEIIQNQQREIEEQKHRLEQLESEMSSMKEQLKKIFR